MKLVIVIDKDGGTIEFTTSRTEDEAWTKLFQKNTESVSRDFYIQKMMSRGYSIKELHTYDPATQVVVDREVYEITALVIKSLLDSPASFSCSSRMKLNIFLSAGKGIQPKCSCIPYEYGSGNEVPDNSKCPVHGKEAT